MTLYDYHPRDKNWLSHDNGKTYSFPLHVDTEERLLDIGKKGYLTGQAERDFKQCLHNKITMNIKGE